MYYNSYYLIANEQLLEKIFFVFREIPLKNKTESVVKLRQLILQISVGKSTAKWFVYVGVYLNLGDSNIDKKIIQIIKH
jgi:hypothetical protein